MTQFDSIIIGDESLTRHCAETLLSDGHQLSALVTDDPDLAAWAKGRKIRVESHGPDLAARLSGVTVDWVLSIANLKLLPRDVLELGRKGAVNFHDGPLPKRAGLNAPVWALIDGETTHGITWHLIDTGVDTGDILVQRMIDITPDDTALTLNTKCYEVGLTSFPDLLSALADGCPDRHPQDVPQRSYHALTDRPEANGLLWFDQPADTALRLIRALDHGAYWNPLCRPKLRIGDGLLMVGQASRTESSAAPGLVIGADARSLTVAFADGALRLSDLTDATGAPVTVTDHVSVGDALPVVSEAERAAMTEMMRTVARRDAHWRHVLSTTRPLRLPFPRSDAPSLASEETGIAATHLAPALAVLANRLSNGAGSALALSNPDLAKAAQTGLTCPWVPVSAETLAGGIPEIGTGFAVDLPLRDPALSPLSTPALALSLDAGPVQGAAITFEMSGGSVTAHVDAGRIAPDYAQCLIRRLHFPPIGSKPPASSRSASANLF